MWSEWVVLAVLAVFGTVAIARLGPNTFAQVGTAPSPPAELGGDSAPTFLQETSAPQSPSTSPRRLTIQVSVADPKDLKVSEGDRVTEGQLMVLKHKSRKK